MDMHFIAREFGFPLAVIISIIYFSVTGYYLYYQYKFDKDHGIKQYRVYGDSLYFRILRLYCVGVLSYMDEEPKWWLSKRADRNFDRYFSYQVTPYRKLPRESLKRFRGYWYLQAITLILFYLLDILSKHV